MLLKKARRVAGCMGVWEVGRICCLAWRENKQHKVQSRNEALVSRQPRCFLSGSFQLLSTPSWHGCLFWRARGRIWGDNSQYASGSFGLMFTMWQCSRDSNRWRSEWILSEFAPLPAVTQEAGDFSGTQAKNWPLVDHSWLFMALVKML